LFWVEPGADLYKSELVARLAESKPNVGLNNSGAWREPSVGTLVLFECG
jgi:hypothetical protein